MEIKKKKRELLPYHGLSSKIVQFVVESVARLWLQRLQIPNQVRVFLCPCVGPVSWHIVIMALYFMINLELTILSLHEYSFKIWILRYSSLFDLIPWENFDVLLCWALCPHECILIHSDLLPILKMCVATRVPDKITWNLTLPVSITRPRQRSIFAVPVNERIVRRSRGWSPWQLSFGVSRRCVTFRKTAAKETT